VDLADGRRGFNGWREENLTDGGSRQGVRAVSKFGREGKVGGGSDPEVDLTLGWR
jgi:hypothetical protein